MRSTLFVPGDSEKKFIKAMSATGMSRPDGLILDLEDSVAASEKPKARQMTASFIAAARAKADAPRQYVRINPVETSLWREDLAAIMGAAPDGIFQPKCRSGADVMALANALDEAERQHGLAVGSTRIMAIITEVPISLLNLSSYVGCSARVEALTWGAEDLSAAMGSLGNRDASGAYTSPFRLARDLPVHRHRRQRPAGRHHLRQLQGRQGVGGGVPGLGSGRLHRQDRHPSRSDRHHQRGVHAERRRDRKVQTHHLGLR